jgi:phage gp45-like
MLMDQLTPHLSKDNVEVNAHVKCLQAMLDVATVVRGNMTIMVPSTTNLTDSTLPKEGATQEESKLFSTT